MKSTFAIFNTVIAISAGLVVLLGYFFPALAGVRDILLQWAVILAGFAMLVGVINLISTHLRKISKAKRGGIYSLVLVFSFLASVIIFGFSGLDGNISLRLFNSVQVSVESTLLALLTVILAYAAIRLFRKGVNRSSVLFMVTFIVVLLSTAPLYGLSNMPLLTELREWVTGVPVAAGARGILIGVALGTLAAGLRILMGADRPYSR
jgi:hypothetical protein